jgi:indoleamine 2,3-dioxygenase
VASLLDVSLRRLSVVLPDLCRSGWRNNPALPDGLVYAGLWGNQPQQLYGETGAQSTIVPAFDAVLGIQHQKGW